MPRLKTLAAAVGAAAALATLAAPPVGGQSPDSVSGSPAPSSAGPLLTRRELRTGIAVAAAGAALVPFDVAITRRLRSPELHQSRASRRAALVFDGYGAPGAQVAGPALILLGDVTGRPGLADAGLHVSEAYVVAGAVAFAVKGLAGRARPYAPGVDRAGDFQLGRGYLHREPFSSFPSGHATGSFAFASAVTAEVGRWSPRHARLVGVLAYGGAVLDGVSRVYRDCHYPSDVAAGAVIGTLSGLAITRRQHANPDNRVDAVLRRVTFAPEPGGRLRVGLAAQF